MKERPNERQRGPGDLRFMAMPSSALLHWRIERAANLDSLLAAHEVLAGPGPGRKWRTEQLNWSLIVRLAAEFQGFCMELHELGAEEFARLTSPKNKRVQTVVRNALTSGRELDRGNAQYQSLKVDFGRFGVDWWAAVAGRDPLSQGRGDQLNRLNRARNSVVHDKAEVRQQLRDEGYPLTLKTFRIWRQSHDLLATTMDAELAETLAQLFAVPAPW